MPTTPILVSSKYGLRKKVGIYIGEDYPNEITLNYPVLRSILSKPKKVHTNFTDFHRLIEQKKIRVIREICEKQKLQ